MHEQKNGSRSLFSSLCLLTAAVFWGTTFVAQSIAMDTLEPYIYNACRFLLGAVVLFPPAVLIGRRDPLSVNYRGSDPAAKKGPLLQGGILCGLCLFFAGSFQQVGMQYTTAGKAGFITALYIVLVPVFGLFLKRKCSPLIVPAVALAVVGFFFLCIKEGFSVGRGDAIVMCCSFVFAMHILTVDHFSPRVDPVQLSCLQFLTAGLMSLIPAFLFETPHLADILACWKPIAYAGILSSGVAYTLQIIGQRGLHPAVAALIMSLESVISALSGWLVLGDVLTKKEFLGCILVFAAVVLAQVPLPSAGQKK